jgi:hypothetical protein
MKHLEDQERKDIARAYNLAEVDPGFIPYLERINSKPFVASSSAATATASIATLASYPRTVAAAGVTLNYS